MVSRCDVTTGDEDRDGHTHDGHTVRRSPRDIGRRVFHYGARETGRIQPRGGYEATTRTRHTAKAGKVYILRGRGAIPGIPDRLQRSAHYRTESADPGRHTCTQKCDMYILSPKQGIPPLAAARMQRWVLILTGYNYDIQYRSTHAHANADGLSRLPIPDGRQEGNLADVTAFVIGQLEALPMQATEVEDASRADPILGKVLEFLRQGWPKRIPDEVAPFWRRKDELSIEGDCIMWGIRVVIPKLLQSRVMSELHSAHPGIVRMKELARSHVWWPGLNKDIEMCVRACESCQGTRNVPTKAPLHPWAWPTNPWERVHIDFAGPVQGKMLLIVTDAHSKWPEVRIMSSTTSAHTISALREMFAHFGLPQQVVSDNGPQFTSEQFAHFMAVNGVKHIQTSPYHPASNGAAERLVQTVKQGLRSALRKGVSLDQALQAILLRYRTTPQSTTGVSPSVLMFGRNLRTRLDLLRPEVGVRVSERQEQQQQRHNQHCQHRELSLEQLVWVRNWRVGARWLKAKVQKQLGPLTYLVQLENGECWRRHIDHLRVRYQSLLSEQSLLEEGPAVMDESNSETENMGAQNEDPGEPEPAPTSPGNDEPAASHDGDCGDNSFHSDTSLPRRYPSRVRQAPDRLYARLETDSEPGN